MTDPSNPLLSRSGRIPFHRIRPEHVVPAVRTLLQEARKEIEAMETRAPSPSWEGTIGALDALTARLRRGTTPVQHLLAVRESRELREAWREVLPELTAFWSNLYRQEGIWAALQAYDESQEAAGLPPLERRHLDKTLNEFRRSGAELGPRDRARLEAIDVELSELQQAFSENVLDATAGWTLHIDDEERLAGIPEDARNRFREGARQEDLDGWVLTLDAPSFLAVMKHARDRELRREIHEAYLARGAEEPHSNLELIPRILELRQEKAGLLGYNDFPDYRLEEQMAGTGAQARAFVEEMVARTRPYWEEDLALLQEHASAGGLDHLRPWDSAFLIQDLRKENFDLDEEELRPYFPLDRVLSGLFQLMEKLFGFRIREAPVEEVWHEDVRHFEIHDPELGLVGTFYADLFPRTEKRQGAWMADFLYADIEGGKIRRPHVATICANFPPPDGDRPALLSHRDVQTLFHEFGHLLHHCASRVPIEGRGGINVAWDWVELPSQLLENWTWEREALDLFAAHWKTGEPLPESLFARMQKARRFMGGWTQMRQLTFGTLDLALHTDFRPGNEDEDVLEWVTRKIRPLSPDDHFARAHPLPSFLHLFPGGYAASYYAYLWSEVLEADLFGRFRETGIFSRETGRAFVDKILSRGDSSDPDQLFRDFMGRDPDPEALIRRNLGDAA
ncbi:MAG: M3 family peptidase [Gemmatimonadales bacterium]|nr:MAG: M3 family peptidase [Gemmatimonadales bacterium]